MVVALELFIKTVSSARKTSVAKKELSARDETHKKKRKKSFSNLSVSRKKCDVGHFMEKLINMAAICFTSEFGDILSIII